MALVARPAHDIILRPSIPLAATSDQPLAEVVRPPEGASNDQGDQSSGVPKEISPEDLAAADAARKGDPSTAEMTDDGGEKNPPEQKTDSEQAEDDGIQVDDAAPFWAKKQIQEIRKKAADRVKAIREAAQAEVGDEKWTKAWEAANANVVGKYRDEVNKTQAEVRRLTAEREELAKKVAEYEAAPPKPKEEEPQQQAAADPRPNRDDFDDPDLFAEALIAWGKRDQQREFDAKQATEKAEAERVAAEEKAALEAKEAEEQEAKVAEERAKLALDWQTKVAAAEERYGDYEAVVMRSPEDGGPTVTPVMAEALTRTDNGPDVAYWLALNPEESVRISELQNPIVQYGEIMKLSGRLSAPTARQRPRVPPPIKPIEGSRAEPQAPNPDDEDMESYFNRRTPQIVQARRPFFPNGGLH